jgi:uncharacterized protein (DUF697 family)
MSKFTPPGLSSAIKFVKNFRSLNSAEIIQEVERPFGFEIKGSEENSRALLQRLMVEAPGRSVPPKVGAFPSVDFEPKITLDADELAADEEKLALQLAQIVVDYPAIRLSLASRIPAFRPAVVAGLIHDASWNNARIAVISALPGIIPFTEMLLPATALGDMVILTRNQAVLLLKIAASYGLPVHLRDRTKELLPVVGTAFGWRAVARELIGMVPGGIGIVVKGAIAFAGTYTVGRAASIYYSTGTSLKPPRLKKLYLDAYRSAVGQVRQMVKRERNRGAEHLLSEEHSTAE